MNYGFTGEAKVGFGIVLRRIVATADFKLKCGIEVHKGETGGWIEKTSNLSDDAWVSDEAEVYGDAKVFGNARVFDDAKAAGHSRIFGNAWIYGNANVCGNSMVFDDAEVYDDAEVSGDAWVFGDARVSGYADICGDARVKTNKDFSVFKNTWSSFRWFTYTRSNKKWAVECFHGTGEELIKKAYADSEKSGKCYEAIVKAQELIDSVL